MFLAVKPQRDLANLRAVYKRVLLCVYDSDYDITSYFRANWIGVQFPTRHPMNHNMSTRQINSIARHLGQTEIRSRNRTQQSIPKKRSTEISFGQA
jgi:hypothetical protein